MDNLGSIWSSYLRSLKLRQRSPRTIENYQRSLQRLSERTEGSLTTLGRADLESFAEKRLEEVAGTTVAKELRDIRAFYRWALKEEYVDRDPTAKLEKVNATYESKRVFSSTELKQILGFRGNTFRDFRDRAILRILCEPGSPRVGELVGMTLKSVDLSSDLISLTGKTGSRQIPIGLKTANAIEKYLRVRDDHNHSTSRSLWLALRGPLTDKGVQDLVRRRCKAVGILGAHPHLFRHTSASRASEAGIPDSLMEPLFGWTDNSVMTRVYGASTRNVRAHQAARKLGLGDQL